MNDSLHSSLDKTIAYLTLNAIRSENGKFNNTICYYNIIAGIFPKCCLSYYSII